jgi:hypothetical protein
MALVSKEVNSTASVCDYGRPRNFIGNSPEERTASLLAECLSAEHTSRHVPNLRHKQ